MGLLRLIAALEPTENTAFVLVSSDPSVSPGVDLGVGSIAIAKDTAAVYLKTGVLATDWTIDTSALTEIAAASLDGTVVKVSAADAVIGAIPIVFEIAIAAGALAAKNVVMTHKIRVLDASVVLEGAGVASTTLTVGNGATAITNAMDVSGSDKALVRAATIDDASQEIAAGGSLRVTCAAGATQPACRVRVTALRVA